MKWKVAGSILRYARLYLYFSIFENLCIHTQNFDIVEFNYKITPSNHMLIWKKLLRKSTIGLRLFRHERNRNEVIRHIYNVSILFNFYMKRLYIHLYYVSFYIRLTKKNQKCYIFLFLKIHVCIPDLTPTAGCSVEKHTVSL